MVASATPATSFGLGRNDESRSTVCRRVTVRHRIGSFAILALLAVTFACGGSSPSASSSPTAASNSPAGGPVPTQLIGDWSLSAEALDAILQVSGNSQCPKPLSVQTCMASLRLTATHYSWVSDLPLDTRAGDVVVNQSEMDFFNGPACGLKLPQGVGRYTWTITGAVMRFVALGPDPCPRSVWLANQSYTRVG
jgi:hypothetical protein